MWTTGDRLGLVCLSLPPLNSSRPNFLTATCCCRPNGRPVIFEHCALATLVLDVEEENPMRRRTNVSFRFVFLVAHLVGSSLALMDPIDFSRFLTLLAGSPLDQRHVRRDPSSQRRTIVFHPRDRCFTCGQAFVVCSPHLIRSICSPSSVCFLPLVPPLRRCHPPQCHTRRQTRAHLSAKIGLERRTIDRPFVADGEEIFANDWTEKMPSPMPKHAVQRPSPVHGQQLISHLPSLPLCKDRRTNSLLQTTRRSSKMETFDASHRSERTSSNFSSAGRQERRGGGRTVQQRNRFDRSLVRRRRRQVG